MNAVKPLEPIRFADQPEPSEAVGTPGEMIMVELDKLVIDDRYQRRILKRGVSTIREILEDFHWSMFDPLVIAPADDKDGHYAIIDGQHRATAALMHPDIDRVPAILHTLDMRGQARAFKSINSVVTQMSPLQVHHAALAGGDHDALFVHKVTQACAIKVLRYPKPASDMDPGDTMAIGKLSSMLKAHGEAPVRKALAAFRKAYPLRKGVSARDIHILVELANTRRDLSEDALTAQLREVDLDRVYGRARRAAAEKGGSVQQHALLGLLGAISMVAEVAA